MPQLMADRPLAAVAGRFTIQLAEIHTDVWQVEVLTSGAVARPVEQLTRSYQFRSLAYAVYKALDRALSTPGATIATARRAVVVLVDAQIDWLLTQPGIAGRVEKVEILLAVRAGFAADDNLAAVTA